MMQKLPLFPLSTVLYPGAQIALHIFEERYRQMIGRCLEETLPFGVVLIRSGGEVDPNDPFIRQLREGAGGEPAEPRAETTSFSVGTTARIAEAHRFDDGRYYLTVVGVRRFRVQYLLHHQPYQMASVATLPEQTGPDLPPLAEALRTLYTQYWQALGQATGQMYEIESLPDDPLELSYALAHRMQVDLLRKQRWLEADAATRLRELGAAIQGELSLMPGARPSGDGPWTWN